MGLEENNLEEKFLGLVLGWWGNISVENLNVSKTLGYERYNKTMISATKKEEEYMDN